jgi:LacI family transcriptional regulator
MEAVEQLGYKPSIIASSLASGHSNLIGVIVPKVWDSVFGIMVSAVAREAHKRRYNIILCETNLELGLEKEFVDMVYGRRVEGVIIAPYAPRNMNNGAYTHLIDLEASGVPVVVMGTNTLNDSLTRVLVDNTTDGRGVTRHLIDCGHKRIGVFHSGLEEWNIAYRERLSGYKQALEESGLDYDESLVIQTQTTLASDHLDSENIIEDYLSRKDSPSAIFLLYDYLVFNLLKVAASMSMRVPQNLAIASIDNTRMSAHVQPSLTTLQQANLEVGARSAEMLFEKIGANENGLGETAPITELIPGHLIVRESCGARAEG